MGEKITRRTRSGERDHARVLRQALKNNTPVFSVGTENRASDTASSGLSAANSGLQSAYLEQLIECAPEAISILDTDMRIVRLNGEFTRIFGFSPQEALGQKLEPMIVPPDRGAETRWIQGTLVQGRKVVLETKRKRKDGSLVDVFVSSAPIVMAGQHVGVCVLYRDISEQKRTEALSSALLSIAEKANSAKDLHHFYAATHNIVSELMYARNFYIALFDPATQLLTFPYFVDEADPRPMPKKLGKGLTEYVLRTATPLLCTPELFESLVAQGEVELIGAPSLDWLGVPLKVGNNTIGVVVVQSYSGNVRFGEKEKNILTFVSQQLASAVEHKRNEEALRRSEVRYRSLIQSAVHGIYRCDLDGKFLDVNPALVAMLAYDTPEDVMTVDPQKDIFVDPEELSHLLRNFGTGKTNNVEVRWKRKDGKNITVRLSGRAVQTSDESSQALEIIAEDVSEQRVLENQFRQAQKMEAVGRLAGGVAHDFNNLLMVISGYSEVLLERTGAQHPLYPKIQAIHHATERASAVTRQLLAFSRKQMLELKVVDVNAIVLDMERLLRPLIGEDVQLQTKLAKDLGRTRADSGQIEQVIMNLVVNSKDAMPAGGKITIQTANIVLGGEEVRREYSYIKPGSYIMLSVTDSGHGMDKETQARIFEPFFTTKEKGKGTGLGLSTVYGIVKQSGGYILAQSELGQGTTFRIYLPRIDDIPEPQHHQPVAATSHSGSETVLLVEDEESVRELVRETLESKGYRVLDAANGEAALRLIENLREPLDALITDVVMPGMSGRELASRICLASAKTIHSPGPDS